MDRFDPRLTRLFRDLGTVLDCQPVSGGCISSAWRVWIREGAELERSPSERRAATARGRSFFVKSQSADFQEAYCCEVAGLKVLAEAGGLRVPEPRLVQVIDDTAFLVTDWIDLAGRERWQAGFFDRLGQGLAVLHRRTVGQRIGFDADNYLGASRQINRPTRDWIDFVAQYRLGVQLRLAKDSGLAEEGLCQHVERVIQRLPGLLEGRTEETSLLHGDLWSGNYLCHCDGEPVVVDPAVHYGCREAEFGMLLLFGDCPDEFYRAYQDAWPLPSGWRRRAQVYRLYHLLNHLNLFGRGYHAACLQAAADLIRHR